VGPTADAGVIGFSTAGAAVRRSHPPLAPFRQRGSSAPFLSRATSGNRGTDSVVGSQPGSLRWGEYGGPSGAPCDAPCADHSSGGGASSGGGGGSGSVGGGSFKVTRSLASGESGRSRGNSGRILGTNASGKSPLDRVSRAASASVRMTASAPGALPAASEGIASDDHSAAAKDDAAHGGGGGAQCGRGRCVTLVGATYLGEPAVPEQRGKSISSSWVGCLSGKVLRSSCNCVRPVEPGTPSTMRPSTGPPAAETSGAL